MYTKSYILTLIRTISGTLKVIEKNFFVKIPKSFHKEHKELKLPHIQTVSNLIFGQTILVLAKL